jgi:hypothetical protein
MTIDYVLVSFIPAMLVLLACYLVLNRSLKADEKRRDSELLLTSKRITLPMRLQAYERLILFLERISPDSMLLRLTGQAQTNSDLHLAMLQNIRSEYEHNLSQQLYVSHEVWEKVKSAKEYVVVFLNEAAKETKPDETSFNLSKMIFDKLITEGESPVQQTLIELKSEAQKII